MRPKQTISIQKSIARATQLKNKSVDLHVKEPTLEETEQMLKEITEDFPKIFGVPKGSRYRAEDGEWYEAEEDAMIVVRCGAGEQMMTQAEYERMKHK